MVTGLVTVGAALQVLGPIALSTTMKTLRNLAAAALATALTACPSTTPPQPTNSATAPEVPIGPAAPTAPAVQSAVAQQTEAAPRQSTAAPAPAATHSCPAGQFVACTNDRSCRRRRLHFIHPVQCFARAADGCAASACEHGCDIHGTEQGGPKVIVCASNASSTGHMKRCGGYSGWKCPENMSCKFSAEAKRMDDATGTCVPDARSNMP